jgi:DNA-binding transcriptional LysR family regulator
MGGGTLLLTARARIHRTPAARARPIQSPTRMIRARYHRAVELRHLRAFVAVAEELHFGRAAARLHISQPPLSQQIRQLEEEIGGRLFRRTNRQVNLTPVGRAFLTDARRALAAAERALRTAQRAGHGEVGELVVGYVTSATYGPLPEVIRVFRKRLPEVEVTLQNLRSVYQAQALIDRRIDIGFARPHAFDARIIYEALWRDSVVVALPSDHPQARRTVVDVADLAADVFVIARAEEAVAFHHEVFALCRREGFTPRVADGIPDVQAAMALVAAGLGISPVPAALQRFRPSGVVFRPLRPRTLRIEMGLAWRRDDDSALVQQFRRIARETARGAGRNAARARIAPISPASPSLSFG